LPRGNESESNSNIGGDLSNAANHVGLKESPSLKRRASPDNSDPKQ
jgi:hypothetical protein